MQIAKSPERRPVVIADTDNGKSFSESETYTALGQPQTETFGSARNVTVANGYYPLTPGQNDPSPSTESPNAPSSVTIQNLPNGQASAVTGYGYDPGSKRLQTITVNGVTFTIAYLGDSSSQIASITTRIAGANTLTTTFTPDGSDASRLGEISVQTSGGSTLFDSTLGYNQLDQITTNNTTSFDDAGTQHTDNKVYTYGTGPNDTGSDANSLTQVTDNGAVTESYAFDGVGNFINDPALGDANTLNQYARLSYNLRGDVTNDGTYAYAYDANDRMASVTPDNPQAGSDELKFGYDSQGQGRLHLGHDDRRVGLLLRPPLRLRRPRSGRRARRRQRAADRLHMGSQWPAFGGHRLHPSPAQDLRSRRGRKRQHRHAGRPRERRG